MLRLASNFEYYYSGIMSVGWWGEGGESSCCGLVCHNITPKNG
jgi:hypothetical protein